MNSLQRFGLRLLGIKAANLNIGQVSREDGAPVHVAGYQDGRVQQKEWDSARAVSEGLKANTWVYTACTKIARGLSSIPFVLKQLEGEVWMARPDHPLQKLLNRPNPFMARQDVQERWVLHLMLSGNALMYKNMVGGVPVELWPLLPDQVRPIPSRLEYLAGYYWQPSASDRIFLEPGQVAHWMLADPSNPYWGLSPLMAAANAVDTDSAASAWNRATLANDGRPPLAIFLTDGLTLAQQREAAGFIREQINGAQARKALVLGGARDAKPLSMNAAELDFLNSRRFTREEIGAAFGVPSILMAPGESVTYANLEAAKLILWEDTILPLMADFTQGLQTALFPHWALEENQWKIDLDLSGVRALQANLKTTEEARWRRSMAAQAFVQAGWPINDVNRVMNLTFQDVDGGDVGAAPATPTGQPLTQAKKARAGPKSKKDKTDEAARLGRMDEWEARITASVSTLLENQGKGAAAAYLAGTLDSSELGAGDWQSLLGALHQVVLEQEGAAAFAALASSLAPGTTAAFDVLTSGVVDYIENHTGEAVQGITDTTRTALQALIESGVENGDSSATIAKSLQTQFGDWSKARAQLIARTEVTTAFSAAHQLSAEQLSSEADLEMVKTWRSAHDSRVRDAHAAMDGETVGMDEAFSNGLEYPSEPNCRCTLTYHPKEG